MGMVHHAHVGAWLLCVGTQLCVYVCQRVFAPVVWADRVHPPLARP